MASAPIPAASTSGWCRLRSMAGVLSSGCRRRCRFRFRSPIERRHLLDFLGHGTSQRSPPSHGCDSRRCCQFSAGRGSSSGPRVGAGCSPTASVPGFTRRRRHFDGNCGPTHRIGSGDPSTSGPGTDDGNTGNSGDPGTDDGNTGNTGSTGNTGTDAPGAGTGAAGNGDAGNGDGNADSDAAAVVPSGSGSALVVTAAGSVNAPSAVLAESGVKSAGPTALANTGADLSLAPLALLLLMAGLLMILRRKEG